MADRTVIKEPPASQKGFFGRFMDVILKTIGLLMFSMFMSILIEWVGMIFFYPDSGYHHAEMLMKQELSYLEGSASGSEQNDKFIHRAEASVASVIDFLFVDSGVMQKVENLRIRNPSDGKIVATAKAFIAEYYNFLMAAIFIICMFIVRLAILVLSTPIFILFGVVGLADGLMQRDLRRWCGGNESGYIYHWAKRFAFPVLMLAWFVYLAIPSSVHPNLIIIPFAILFGLVLMVMSSKFKKYL